MPKAKNDTERAVRCYKNGGFYEWWDLAIVLVRKNREMHRRAQRAESNANALSEAFTKVLIERNDALRDADFWRRETERWRDKYVDRRSWFRGALDAIFGRD